jgi:predicted DNA-binding protein
MEIHYAPELEAKLNEMAAQTGRATDELVRDVMAGYFEETADVRRMLDRRYDEIKSGKVKPVDGERFLRACANVKTNCSSSARRAECRTRF